MTSLAMRLRRVEEVFAMARREHGTDGKEPRNGSGRTGVPDDPPQGLAWTWPLIPVGLAIAVVAAFVIGGLPGAAIGALVAVTGAIETSVEDAAGAGAWIGF